jgi:drug/metabolite transporter (DMT)-like permease
MWILWTLLSVFSWSLVNVLDSVLVHRFEKHPLALMWSQSLVSVPILIVLSFFLPLQVSWIPFLLVFGIIGYLGDVWFFHVLDHVDVSVSNIAWSILSLLLALTGLLFFQEGWGVPQTLGALLIVVGTFFLSFFHQKLNVQKTLVLVCMLATLYLPYYIAKKIAIDRGIPAESVFFWMLAGREMTSILVPLFMSKVRYVAVQAMRGSYAFMLVNAIVIVLFLLAEFFGALAYQSGSLSLVAITANVQPFMVMGIAWVFLRIKPSHSARELLTRQSVVVKIISFSIVFLGLALLTFSH